ncbi:hypothetical protein ACFE04_029955 [Oxalis oulophora]
MAAVPMDNEQNVAALSYNAAKQNWNINVSDIKTVKVSNVALTASAKDIQEFFSFSGDIQYVEMRKETETSQLAYITFKDAHGAEMAILLSGARIGDLSISIIPVEDYQLPPGAILIDKQLGKLGSVYEVYSLSDIFYFACARECSTCIFCAIENFEMRLLVQKKKSYAHSEKKQGANSSAVQRAEDVASTMLAKGFVLGKDAIKKAKVFDERHQLTLNASATIASIDQKMGLAEKLSIGTTVVSEKMKEVDERYQVSEITKSALAVAEQKASSAGSAIMSNRYVSAGTSWLSSAFSVVAKAAEDVGTMTKEKVEKAEEENREHDHREKTSAVSDYANTHLDDSVESPVFPVDSSNNNKLSII